MPHAALWVVQHTYLDYVKRTALGCFNAARGFVGGAAGRRRIPVLFLRSFNAARGFVGGAACAARRRAHR